MMPAAGSGRYEAVRQKGNGVRSGGGIHSRHG